MKNYKLVFACVAAFSLASFSCGDPIVEERIGLYWLSARMAKHLVETALENEALVVEIAIDEAANTLEVRGTEPGIRHVLDIINVLDAPMAVFQPVAFRVGNLFPTSGSQS